jgi:hypothetical protein
MEVRTNSSSTTSNAGSIAVTLASAILRKVTFGVGLEAPSDSPDPIAFVSAKAFLAEERFELLDHFGDRHGFEPCDLGRRCSVHG